MRCAACRRCTARCSTRCDFAASVIGRELNAATDNPLVFETARLLSGGNFHGQSVAMALDFLAIALTNLATISERRIDRLVHPDLNQGLPPFLSRDAGVNSGFMMAQVTAASLASECKVLSHPASVDTIPTDGSKEDVVPMAMAAAWKLRRVVRERALRAGDRADVRGAGHRLPRAAQAGTRRRRARTPPCAQLVRAARARPRAVAGDIERLARAIADDELDSFTDGHLHDRHRSTPDRRRRTRTARAPSARRAARRSRARDGSRKPRCAC